MQVDRPKCLQKENIQTRNRKLALSRIIGKKPVNLDMRYSLEDYLRPSLNSLDRFCTLPPPNVTPVGEMGSSSVRSFNNFDFSGSCKNGLRGYNNFDNLNGMQYLNNLSKMNRLSHLGNLFSGFNGLKNASNLNDECVALNARSISTPKGTQQAPSTGLTAAAAAAAAVVGMGIGMGLGINLNSHEPHQTFEIPSCNQIIQHSSLNDFGLNTNFRGASSLRENSSSELNPCQNSLGIHFSPSFSSYFQLFHNQAATSGNSLINAFYESRETAKSAEAASVFNSKWLSETAGSLTGKSPFVAHMFS